MEDLLTYATRRYLCFVLFFIKDTWFIGRKIDIFTALEDNVILYLILVYMFVAIESDERSSIELERTNSKWIYELS